MEEGALRCGRWKRRFRKMLILWDPATEPNVANEKHRKIGEEYKGRPQMGICLFLGALCRKIFSFGILYSMWLSCSQKDMNLGNFMCEKFKPTSTQLSSVWNALSTLKDKQEKGDFKKWGTAVGTMLICWGWDAFLSYPLWSTARQGYKKFPSNRFADLGAVCSDYNGSESTGHYI